MGLNLPFVNPYLDKSANFDHGVNFAVAGATALNHTFFLERGISMPYTNSSLNVQLDWFKTHLNSICFSRAECAKRLETALFLVGEIGGNDYNYAFFQGKPIEEVKTYVPHVVAGIIDAAKEVIHAGAVHLIVPGNFPIGCMPSYLSVFGANSNPHAYDENKCLKDLNEFAMFHNKHLQNALESLRQEQPHANIMYADYYHAFMFVLDKAGFFGFDRSSVLKACCGTGGDYNFDMSRMCGTHGVSACSIPAESISWDGVHLTQEAYKIMSKELVIGRHIYPGGEILKEWTC